MSPWGEIFLGVIAVSTLATSVVLIALLITAGRLAKRIDGLTRQIELEMTPVFGHLNAIASDAARAAALATVQVERVDRVFGDLVQRIDMVQGIVSGTLRGSGAVSAGLTAFRAVLDALRGVRASRAQRRKDDEDALFI